MRFDKPMSVAALAQLINAEILSQSSFEALGLNEIHRVEAGDVCFVDHPKYYEACLKSKASHIIMNTKSVKVPENKSILYTPSPFEAYLKIVETFRPFRLQASPINESADIDPSAKIGHHVFIGEQVRVGKNCIIGNGVQLLAYTQVGDNVIIQSGSVIGGDAFYYNTNKQEALWYKKMLSCGHVVIEDNVEIGVQCTIDRGVTADTFIGRGTKIDNQVHIGHDTIVGQNCLFAAQVGIAGGCTIEDGVVLWGQVGVSKTLTIGKNAVVLAQSGVPSSLEGGKTYFGYPAGEAGSKKKELVWIKRIPELWKRVEEQLKAARL